MPKAITDVMVEDGWSQDENGKWIEPTSEAAVQGLLPIDGMVVEDGLVEGDTPAPSAIEAAGIAEAITPHFEAAVPTPENPNPPIIATLIKAGLNGSKTRNYTPEFLQECVAAGRFTEAYCFLDHPSRAEFRDQPERTMARLAARTGDAYWSEATQSVQAPLHWLGKGEPGMAGTVAKNLFADDVVRRRAGLSIWYPEKVDVRREKFAEAGDRLVSVPIRLQNPTRKFDIDLVTDPGAGGRLPAGSLMEANSHQPIGGVADMADELTKEQLAEQYPELVQALQSDAVAAAATETPETAPEPEPVVEAMGRDQTEDIPPWAEALIARTEMLEHDKWRDELLREANLPEAALPFVREIRADSRDAYKAAFDEKVAQVKALAEATGKAPEPRVAGLGSAGPVVGLTGESTGSPKTMADIARARGVNVPGRRQEVND